jgi:hypothetical protein
MDLTTLMGTIGALIILGTFILNQTGTWKAENFYYDLANFVGSAILFVYAMFIRSYPFVVVNIVWMAVSVRDIYNTLKKP